MSVLPRVRRVMISSTTLDLPEHRRLARDACERLSMLPLVMEQMPASTADAFAISSRFVDEADLYLGIFAFRYGFVPEGQEKSIAEAEYERAVARGIPKFIFLASDKHPVSFDDVEAGAGRQKLQALKERLKKDHVVRTFRSSEELRTEIIHALSSYQQEVHEREETDRAVSNKPTNLTVFLCYRREDTQDAAGRLHDRLADAYGHDRVFMDVDSVPLGIDFVEHVSEQISRCSAVIVMIGKRWLTIKDRRRRRRLDNEDDLVRAEIRAALHQKIPVIPVVVQDASMPGSEDLPEDIRLLARRNGIQLRADQWRQGVDRLLRELDLLIGRQNPR